MEYGLIEVTWPNPFHIADAPELYWDDARLHPPPSYRAFINVLKSRDPVRNVRSIALPLWMPLALAAIVTYWLWCIQDRRIGKWVGTVIGLAFLVLCALVSWGVPILPVSGTVLLIFVFYGILLSLSFGIPASMLWWYEWRRIPAGHCRECGYDLTGNTSGICPECGTPIADDLNGKLTRNDPERTTDPPKE
ncbi:MAG: hypothetical protein JXQ75_17805 [Phycisphaerae bacterium]|nr:hypothetical protein [Phycisphaerae bacterium]